MNKNKYNHVYIMRTLSKTSSYSIKMYILKLYKSKLFMLSITCICFAVQDTGCELYQDELLDKCLSLFAVV